VGSRLARHGEGLPVLFVGHSWFVKHMNSSYTKLY
jgi:hypothetical protein